MFTGYHVEEHQAIHHEATIDTDATVWHNLASKFGYATSLFTTNPIISRTSNLHEAFKTVRPLAPLEHRQTKLFSGAYGPTDSEALSTVDYLKQSLRSDTSGKALVNCIWRQAIRVEDSLRDEPETSSDKLLSAFLNWEKKQEGPWATCINLMDTHGPYAPSKQYNLWADESLKTQNRELTHEDLFKRNADWSTFEAFEGLYDGTIRQVDSIVQDLISELQRRESYENTLIVVTSDHGEGFGERSVLNPRVRMLGHGWGIHEVLTHVPLLVKYPGQEEAETVERVASLTRFPEVVLSTVEAQSETFAVDEYAVVSTYRLCREEKERYFDNQLAEKHRGPWRAVYTDGDTVRKHIKNEDRGAVLDIPDAQSGDVVGDDVQIVDEVFGSLTDAGITNQKVRDMTPELEERLESLGYLP